ncbi:HD domain-containing phosphohydrolase [Thalassotalea fusca]
MSLPFLEQSPQNDYPPWKVLIVDDEKDVHTITQMALKRFELENRHIDFYNAYSAEEAKEILRNQRDIALVFLDVVMETDDAGLNLAKWMREDLNNHFTRIVLRTGQPGQAPEEQVIVDYDINDYKEKTELDRKKLFTTVYSSLRAYRDIVSIEEARKYQERYRMGLERVIDSSSQVLDKRTLHQFFDGLLEQVISLLRINKDGVLLQVSGLGAIYTEDDFEVLAQISYENKEQVIDELTLSYLNKAIQLKHSIIEKDILVGYFPSQTEKVSLLFLKGISTLHEIDIKLLEVFSSNISLAFDNLLLNREIIETQEELIYKLGDVVESRSNEAGNHIRRISEVSYLLAKTLGLEEDECQLLKQAAPMHDIGKIATPDKVLLKPGKLDNSEMATMKQHPAIGHKILSGSSRPILQAAAIISQQHHEKWDGSGYPNGLKESEIHIFARIVAVADVFDALTHKRCYKEAWPIDSVIDYLVAAKGTHLDPAIVDTMLNIVDQAVEINENFQD